MRVILNNIKVLGVFCVLGILTFILTIFLMLNMEEYRTPGLDFATGFFISMYLIIYLGLPFLSGKYFLRSTYNFFLDGASFLLIIILAVICAFYAGDSVLHPLNILFSPKSVMEGFVGAKHEVFSLCITVFFTVCTLFIGMVTKRKIKK